MVVVLLLEEVAPLELLLDAEELVENLLLLVREVALVEVWDGRTVEFALVSIGSHWLGLVNVLCIHLSERFSGCFVELPSAFHLQISLLFLLDLVLAAFYKLLERLLDSKLQRSATLKRFRAVDQHFAIFGFSKEA